MTHTRSDDIFHPTFVRGFVTRLQKIDGMEQITSVSKYMVHATWNEKCLTVCSHTDAQKSKGWRDRETMPHLEILLIFIPPILLDVLHPTNLL